MHTFVIQYRTKSIKQLHLPVISVSLEFSENYTWFKHILFMTGHKEDLFICPQEFVVGYSKAPEQPQSSARPICHSHAMTRTGREPATIRIAA